MAFVLVLVFVFVFGATECWLGLNSSPVVLTSYLDYISSCYVDKKTEASAVRDSNPGQKLGGLAKC